MNSLVLRLLSPDEVRQILAGLASADFVDGKATATGLARDVKHNLQAQRAGDSLADLDRLVMAALNRSHELQAFAIPRCIVPPVFSRYEPGMEYGAHVDNALMGAQRIRTDLAMTIFLADPTLYDGGELVIEMPLGRQEIKLDAGEAVIYPASSLHRVAPVTRGARLAVVTWIQSYVADDRIRDILLDLSHAILLAKSLGSDDLQTRLNKAYHNLLRYAVH
jgi:PKHD-type hydroxylase